MSCYIKYYINLVGKSDKNHLNIKDKSKYLISEGLQKLKLTLIICIIRNKEEFFFHHVTGYFKKL